MRAAARVFGAQTYGLRSRFLDEIPAELLDEPQASGRCGPGGARRARAPAAPRRRRSGARRTAAAPAASPRARHGRRRRAFRLGEDIVHAAFGEASSPGVEPGGVIVVRFAGDGSERKLMAEYAPVSRR